LAELFPRTFAEWLLGQPVSEVEVLKTELSTEAIHADALLLLRLTDSLLHFEFQTRPRSKPPVPLRMLDYWVREYRKYELPITQFVIYLCKTNQEIPTEFRAPNTWHRYNVILIWEQPAEIFLNSPALLPLAVLARSAKPKELVKEVAARVMQIEEPSLRSEVAACTHFLAGLRFGQRVLKGLFREEIMEESVTFQEFKQRFLQQGELRGELRGELKTVLRLLRHKCGPLPAETEALISTFDQMLLDALSVALLNFQQLADLDNWLAAHAVRH
jgi:predicted transposase YdaD